MGLTLGSNIASLRTIRYLHESSSKLGDTLSRLSSGQRINRASDDAAGLAIADSLRVDARLYTQASRNINDGISMLNIIDGALNSQTDIITRLKELAEQSANGVISNDQRSSLSQEYRSLLDEFGRIAETTKFNGQSLINEETQSSFNILSGITSGIESIISFLAPRSGLGYGNIGSKSEYDGVDGINGLDTLAFLNFVTSPHTKDEFFDFMGNDFLTESVVDSQGAERTLYIVNALEEIDGDNGFTYVFYEDADGLIYGAGSDNPTGDDYEAQIALTFTDTGATGSVNVNLNGYNIFSESDGPYTKTAIDFTGIETVSRALDALDVLTTRLEDLSSVRGEIGAVQSRLSLALNISKVSAQGAFEAESRIRDADITQEAAEMVRQQILQQAATSVLAQANIQPNLALTLLQ